MNILVAGVVGVTCFFSFLQLALSGAYFNYSFETQQTSFKKWNSNAATEHVAISSIIAGVIMLVGTAVTFTNMFLKRPSASVAQTLFALAYCFVWVAFGFACKSINLGFPSNQCSPGAYCKLGSAVNAINAFAIINWMISTANFAVTIFFAGGAGGEEKYESF